MAFGGKVVDGLPAAAKRLEPGDPAGVGPYELLARLGQGGMGRVYLARHAGSGPGAADRRHVAIKVISPDLAGNPEVRALFEREARAAQRVARFCTAEVIDVEVAGPQPYLVTEFIDGPSLEASVAHRRALPAAEVERLAISVATALRAIHAARMIHRDLTPGNIMLSPSGPLVIDFGIARALDAVSTASIRGTPAFMAPEQAGGQTVTTAADIHAWGGILLFAATGRRPFRAATLPELLARIVREEPDLSGLPDTLRPLVAHAMAKNPRARPTAPELHELVTEALQSARTAATTANLPGIRARPVPPAPVPPAPAPSAPASSAPVSSAPVPPSPAAPARISRTHVAPTPRPRRRITRRAGLIGIGAGVVVAVLAALLLIDRGSDAPPTSASILAARAPQPVGQPLAGHRQAVLSVAFTADGRTLASGGYDGTVRLWNLADPARAAPFAGPLTTAAGPVRTVATSRDGTLLASASLDTTIQLWNITRPAVPAALGPPLTANQGHIGSIAFSQDGSLLAAAGSNGSIHLWHLHPTP